MIADPDVLLVDARNTYETAIGMFDGAVDPMTTNFREFPYWAQALADQPDDRRPKIAMYCTGGIRCEKASALMQDMGFDEVYHLKGDILKYLEDVPATDSKWHGECFVFDGRVAVNHELQPGIMRCAMPAGYYLDDLAHADFNDGLVAPIVSQPSNLIGPPVLPNVKSKSSWRRRGDASWQETPLLIRQTGKLALAIFWQIIQHLLFCLLGI